MTAGRPPTIIALEPFGGTGTWISVLSVLFHLAIIPAYRSPTPDAVHAAASQFFL